MPSVIPAPTRAHLATSGGLLFNELSHSPGPTLTSVATLLENALDLDPGRYIRGGLSDVLLYVARLAMRVHSYARYLLSPSSRHVRGLRPPALTPEKRRLLSESAASLFASVESQIIPQLLSWCVGFRTFPEPSLNLP